MHKHSEKEIFLELVRFDNLVIFLSTGKPDQSDHKIFGMVHSKQQLVTFL